MYGKVDELAHFQCQHIEFRVYTCLFGHFCDCLLLLCKHVTMRDTVLWQLFFFFFFAKNIVLLVFHCK